MRILALAAAASMSLAPTLTMAQTDTCPENAELQGGACVCSSGFILGPGGACTAAGGEPTVVAVDPGTTSGLPIFEEIPPGAIVVGGLVLLAGAIIGIAAASDDDDGTTTTTTTTTN
jgi:hypothetical protein